MYLFEVRTNVTFCKIERILNVSFWGQNKCNVLKSRTHFKCIFLFFRSELGSRTAGWSWSGKSRRCALTICCLRWFFRTCFRFSTTATTDSVFRFRWCSRWCRWFLLTSSWCRGSITTEETRSFKTLKSHSVCNICTVMFFVKKKKCLIKKKSLFIIRNKVCFMKITGDVSVFK